MTHKINNNYNTNLTDAPDKLKLLLICLWLHYLMHILIYVYTNQKYIQSTYVRIYIYK